LDFDQHIHNYTQKLKSDTQHRFFYVNRDYSSKKLKPYTPISKGAVQTKRTDCPLLPHTFTMQFTHFSGLRNDVPCRYLASGNRLRCVHCDLFYRYTKPVAPVAQPVAPTVQPAPAAPAAQSRTIIYATGPLDEYTAMFVKQHQERQARARTLPNMVPADTDDLQKNDVIRVEIDNKHDTLVVRDDKSVLLVQDCNGKRPMKSYSSIYSYLAILTIADLKFHTVSLNSKTTDYNYPQPRVPRPLPQ